jgi:hypothetical protein
MPSRMANAELRLKQPATEQAATQTKKLAELALIVSFPGSLNHPPKETPSNERQKLWNLVW